MKNKYILLMAALWTFAIPLAKAQDTFLQEGNENAEAQAKSLTTAYQPELVMTGEQTLLFQKKLEEFLIRENRIRDMDLTVEDKLHLLGRLSEQQRAEMTNILTRPQMRRYNKVRHTIQPVAVVVDTLKKTKE